MMSDFTIELGKPESMKFHGNCSEESEWKVTLVETGELAMTGARVARAAKHSCRARDRIGELERLGYVAGTRN